MATIQEQIAAAVNSFKDPRTLKMPVTNTDEFKASSPTYSSIQGRPVKTTSYSALDRSKPHTVNYWPQYGANDPSGGVPYLAAPLPSKTGVGTNPSVGAYNQYTSMPNTGGDPNRLASGSLPFINGPASSSPIDITVRGGNPQTASIPLPQARPWNAPTSMDLAAIAAQEAAMQQPTASAYAPQVAPPPAAAAATAAGQAPQTSWMQDMMTGINGLLAGSAPKPMTPSQSYAATNAAASEAARTQNRSGVGTDGYVRDASGNVIGRDAQYQGLTPSQMYDQINGNSGPARIDGNPDNNTFSRGGGVKFGLTAEQRRNGATVDTGTLRPGLNTRGPAQSRSIAPVSGGIMAPAQAQRPRRAPIMRSA